MSKFKFIKYDKFNSIDKEKVEEVALDMMVKFKYMPLELGKLIPNEWNDKIDKRWQCALKNQRKIREGTLANVMHELSRKKISKAMSEYKNKFIPKRKKILILKRKIDNLVEERKNIWNKIYGLMIDDEKQDENEKAKFENIELGMTKYINGDPTNMVQKGGEQIDTNLIKDDL